MFGTTGMVLGGLLDPLFIVIYNLLKLIGILLWAIDRLLIGIGYFIAKFTEILIDKVFSPGLERLGNDIQVNVLPAVFTVAVLILGITYVLAAFWVKDANLVDWKKAIAWLLGALLFYTASSELFTDGEILRRRLGGVMYEAILDTKAVNCGSSGGTVKIPNLGDLLPAGVVWGTDDSGIGQLCNIFQGDLIYDVAIDGLDVSFAYVFGVKTDLDRSLPQGLENRYFLPYDTGLFADNNWGDIFGAEIRGLNRLFMVIFMIVFGIVEQFVFFVLTMVAAVVFFTLTFALLLSFFTYTENLARSIIKVWFDVLMIGLFASLLQATGVFILLVGTTSLNPIISLATAVMGLFLVFLSARTAVTGAVQMMTSLPVMGRGIQMAGKAASSTAGVGASAASTVLGSGVALARQIEMSRMGGGGGYGGAGGGGGRSNAALQGINALTRPSGEWQHGTVRATEGMKIGGHRASGGQSAAFQSQSGYQSTSGSWKPGLSPTSGMSSRGGETGGIRSGSAGGTSLPPPSGGSASRPSSPPQSGMGQSTTPPPKTGGSKPSAGIGGGGGKK